MNIKENVTVYQCEHCKKKMFRKSAMEFHEKWCSKNPDNIKACQYCCHLKETQIEVSVDTRDGSITTLRKAFKCEKIGKLLFPLVVERRGLNLKYPETFEEQEPMPKDCEHFLS